MEHRKIIIGLVIFILVLNVSFVVAEMRLREQSRLEILAREHRISQLSQLETFNSTYKQAGFVVEKVAQGIKEQVRCSVNDCLTPGTFLDDIDRPYGTATVTGYYTNIVQDSNDKAVTCDAIVISSGPSTLSAYIDKHAHNSSSVSKGKDGEREITVNFDRLSDPEKNMLLRSSKDRPVEMFILQSRDGMGGENSCYTSTAVIDVREQAEEPAPGDGIGY